MTSADKIALAAAIIAACAFFVTIWQAHMSRSHNRLSVRPLLVWRRDCSITEAGTEIALVVRNCGVGPAIVKERFFSVSGDRFSAASGLEDEVQQVVKAVLAQRSVYHLRQHGLPGVGTAIPPGGEHVVARIFFPDADGAKVDSIIEQAGKTSFCIRYESLYGQPDQLLAE